jgi:hypothetical protein
VASSPIIAFLQVVLYALPDFFLIACAFVMYRRRQFTDFPFFFAYICVVVLNDAVRIFANSHLDAWTSFYVYHGTDAVDIGLSFAVLYEVLKNVLTSGTIKISRSTFFMVVCGLLLAAAVLAYVTASPPDPLKDSTLMRAVLLLQGVARFAQVGVLLMFAVLTIFFGFYWGNQAFGIAAGFGLYASIELVNVYFRGLSGPKGHKIFSLIYGEAYLLATVIWLIYALKQRPKPPVSLPNNRLFEFEEPVGKLLK